MKFKLAHKLTFDSNSIRFKLWLYFALFATFLMIILWTLQIFFLNNPNIDFNLVGVVDLLDMPGLSDILRKIIVEQVAAIMVLPNKLPIILNDGVPALSLKMPEPEVSAVQTV